MEKSVYDDQDLTADVAGNGITLPPGSKGIAPPAPKTKNVGKRGLGIFGLTAGAIAGIVVFATSQTPTADQLNIGSKTSDAQESVAATASGAAPKMSQVKERLSSETSNTNSADQEGSARAANQQVAAAQQNTAPPSPREQFQEWLEKHHYDRVRARYIAEDQAYTAKLLEDNNGGGRAQPRTPGVPQVGLPGMPAAMPSQPAAARERAREADETVIQAIVQRELDARRPSREAPLAVPPQQRDDGYLSETVRNPREGHEIAAGTIIPAVMLSAINSDLPGSIVAQVRQPVYSTFHYQQLLIPAGTRMIGRYSSQINYGQERVLVAWDDLIFPNGKRINLGGMSGTDAQGAAGLRDKVDTHFWRTWGNALLVSLIGVAAQQSQPQNQGAFNTPSAGQQAASAAANSLNETASQVLRKNLNVAPTLEIRPGYLFNILVNKSVSLPPYQED